MHIENGAFSAGWIIVVLLFMEVFCINIYRRRKMKPPPKKETKNEILT